MVPKSDGKQEDEPSSDEIGLSESEPDSVKAYEDVEAMLDGFR